MRLRVALAAAVVLVAGLTGGTSRATASQCSPSGGGLRDQAATAAAPVISSFSPTSGNVGTKVTITGSAFTGATTVTFNGVSATFTVVSDSTVTTTVPSKALTGPLSITTPSGTGTSSSSFGVIPKITSFKPTSGWPGVSVGITGTAFTGATTVTFNGVGASFVVNSYTQVTAKVPAAASTGPIAVTTAGGTGASASSFTVTPEPAPTISSFSPTSGKVGTKVTITGSAFTGTTGVTFNGLTASFTVVSDTKITATVPSQALTGSIAVTNPTGTGTSTTSFGVIPTVSSFSPTSGPPGTQVSVTGQSFTGATQVTFNGVGASFVVNSYTQVTATVPTGASTGSIAVTTPGGTGTSTSKFMVTSSSGAPKISGFSPTSGPVGSSVMISGTTFTGATSVKFHGTAAAFTVNSDTQITTTVPSGATTGTITVTTPSGTGTSSTSFGVSPSIASFSPTSGVTGTSVTISGQAFSGATAVAFNGVTTSFTVASYTQITATVPAGAASGPISVTTAGGTGTSADAFTVTASPTPTISGFSPTSGPVGTPVVITGSGFTGATEVSFGGTDATAYSVDSDSQITARVPAGASSGTISVTTPGGTTTSSDSFTVSASTSPVVCGFSPTSGPVGIAVVITGSGLTGATQVSFGGTPATTYSVDSDTQITARVPAGASSGTISVTTPGGTTTSSDSFTVTPIQHILILDLENHSFDNLLGNFCDEVNQAALVRPGYDMGCDGPNGVGAVYGGGTIPLTQTADSGLTLGHGVAGQIKSIDGGKMDGFTLSNGCSASSNYACISDFHALDGTCGTTGTASCIPNLVSLATKFTVSDRTFEFRTTPSWAGHMVLASASMDGFQGDNPISAPGVTPGPGWGCDANLVTGWWNGSAYVNEPSCVPNQAGQIFWNGALQTTPVSYVPTIFDRLDAAGLSWKIYGTPTAGQNTGSGYVWAVCPTFYECLSGPQDKNLILGTQIYTDAKNGTLPNFAIVIPPGGYSEHPPTSTAAGDSGWVGPLIQALEQGPEWSSTAIFMTWDDSGGFYDHVNPLQYNPNWGIRVPLVIISPYAKSGYTDSTPATFVSMLAFTEHTFNLLPLNGDDAASYDYSNAFDYSQSPLGPVRMVHTFVPKRDLRYRLSPDDPT